MQNALQLVLFDLDDTLFDHQHSRRCGLLVLQHAYPPLAQIPIEDLVAEHERQLTASYDGVLNGTVSLIGESTRTIPAHVCQLWCHHECGRSQTGNATLSPRDEEHRRACQASSRF